MDFDDIVLGIVDSNYDPNYFNFKDNLGSDDVREIAIYFWSSKKEHERMNYLLDDDIRKAVDTMLCSLRSYDTYKIRVAADNFKDFLGDHFEKEIWESIELSYLKHRDFLLEEEYAE